MARLTPPDYPVDGEAVYIPADDSAWDHARIQQERKEYAERDPPEEHPVDRYLSGMTRLRLEPVQEYLDMTKKPEQWQIRKNLPPAIRREVDALYARTIILGEASAEALNCIARAYMLAFKYGVEDVKNSPFKIRRDHDRALSDDLISEIDVRCLDDLVGSCGRAVLNALRRMDAAEGK